MIQLLISCVYVTGAFLRFIKILYFTASLQRIKVEKYSQVFKTYKLVLRICYYSYSSQLDSRGPVMEFALFFIHFPHKISVLFTISLHSIAVTKNLIRIKIQDDLQRLVALLFTPFVLSASVAALIKWPAKRRVTFTRKLKIRNGRSIVHVGQKYI